MDGVKVDFIAVGGSRNPAAADWDTNGSGLLAFGAGNNIAIWNPSDLNYKGITDLLAGHTDVVNVVKFLPTTGSSKIRILSGSADKTIRLWESSFDAPLQFQELETISAHVSSINCIAIVPGFHGFASGSADGTIKIWRFTEENASVGEVDLVQTIELRPKYIPLALSLAVLHDSSILLAAAGTKSTIQVYVSSSDQFTQVASLSGHEGWIRSLAFVSETDDERGDLILASASQDKYIRLWRIHEGEELPAISSAASDPALGLLGRSLSNKAHRFQTASSKYSITFEALLLGHEDWIYTAAWRKWHGKLQLLSASADNSLAVWESDPQSGVWVCIARLGEVSAQKGATTATGSTGGFWIGLWSPSGDSVASLGRTGSWRLWKREDSSDMWSQQVAVTGHTKEVKSLTWSKNGDYLLTTSSDQTTRLFAEWKRDDGSRSWHEFSRPQIHGYDLNCIDTISDTQFISGADEKLLRVFDEPSAVAKLLARLCKIQRSAEISLPDAANIPVLGLSNKAIQAIEEHEVLEDNKRDEREAPDPASVVHKSTLDLDHPPLEDHLARHMLWPEREKLYGHGYEISAVAASHDGSIIATACRASSIDHAVIRLYETKDWRELKPPLKSHSLTVHNLRFSPDDEYLLSVGRDRQWTIFQRDKDDQSTYRQAAMEPKGHSRMILDCTWAPLMTDAKVFATAGRDKKINLWRLGQNNATNYHTITSSSAVTAIDFLPDEVDGCIVLAYATEEGALAICAFSSSTPFLKEDAFEKAISPSSTVSRLNWRPRRHGEDGANSHLAVASDDGSVRLYDVPIKNWLKPSIEALGDW
ncbi:WD40 repeat-like protein [Rhizodiscina lignyota]|uniref:Elongator complex protein 2 n=1 Tax=Rhizodiscina lignyota TaxID=1504668 RepID=A0A9P4IK80_9PEZI|nr:WD40 repeat-like protein [Rhizodiscina lignyota]